MANGTVKRFNPQKGYGFIQPEDGSGDVFVHITAVEQAGLRGFVVRSEPLPLPRDRLAHLRRCEQIH